jgi:hypothetical protein
MSFNTAAQAEHSCVKEAAHNTDAPHRETTEKAANQTGGSEAKRYAAKASITAEGHPRKERGKEREGWVK